MILNETSSISCATISVSLNNRTGMDAGGIADVICKPMIGLVIVLRKRRRSEYLNDAVANGVEREVGDGMQVQLAHDVGTVSFGGLDAEV